MWRKYSHTPLLGIKRPGAVFDAGGESPGTKGQRLDFAALFCLSRSLSLLGGRTALRHTMAYRTVIDKAGLEVR